MSESNDIVQRRARLRALRERYRSGAEPARDPAPTPPAEQPHVPASAGSAGGGAAQEGRPLLERLRRYLIAPDGSIDEQHLQQVIQFLRRRAQDTSSPGHTRARRLLQFLEGQGGGRNRERLMRLLQGRGPRREGGGAALPAGGPQPSHDPTGDDHERLARLEEAVERLDRITQALAAHLDRPARRIEPDAAQRRGARAPSSQGGVDDDWFVDFLEEV